MKKIGIIIPCYNEEEVLEITYPEINKYLPLDYQYFFIFIDDGSKDKTLSIIKELAKENKNVKYISFSRNFGKEAAMLAGLKVCKTLDVDATLMLDADLQDPPSLIPEFLKLYEEGYKHIYAKHKTRKGESKLKTFFALTFYKIYALLTGNKNLARGARDYCLLSREVIDAFLSIKDSERFTKGIFGWIGFEKKCIEFDYVPRVKGTTKWNFKKLFKYAIMGIKQFSHFYILIPTICLLISLGVLIYDIIYGFINSFNSLNIRLDIALTLIFFVLRYVFVLSYDIRDQTLNRPIYLVQDGNVKDETIY